MSDSDRDLYVQEITAAAAPDARLLIVAAKPGGPVGFLGLDEAEVKRRFTPAWTVLSAAEEPVAFAKGPANRYTPIAFVRNRFTANCYVLERAAYVSESGGRNRSPYLAASSLARATKASLPVPCAPS